MNIGMTDMEAASFEEALMKYGGIINKVCFYFAASREDLQDLRQDVIINIWKGWEKFRSDSKLSTWIYRVTFNTCVTQFRKKKKMPDTVSLENVIEIADDLSADVEKQKLVYALIRSLNAEDKAMILLWLDEKSYEEIAEITGLKRNTVAVRLMRIKEKLSKMNNR